jgi:hypothetical protein
MYTTHMSIRALHQLVAKIGIAAVFLTQLAVAAHACPVLTGLDHSRSVAAAGAGHASMPGCEKADRANPNLCLQHCQAGTQSAESAPQLPMPAAATIVLTVIEAVQPVAGFGITALSVLPEHETSPPPLVRFRVLRI